MIWPVDSPVYVTSSWNPKRKHPVTGVVKPHTGTDFRARSGAVLRAVSGGIVVTSSYFSESGNFVKIVLDEGATVSYSHLSVREVSAGQRVYMGQRIGLAGATGLVNAAHLHFEVIDAGVKVNPVPWLAARMGISNVSNSTTFVGTLPSINTGTSAPQPLEEDFMSALTTEEQRRLLAWADNGTARLEQVYNASLTLLARKIATADVDEEALSASLAPLLLPQIVAAVGAQSGLTTAQIEAATENALREVLGSLN